LSKVCSFVRAVYSYQSARGLGVVLQVGRITSHLSRLLP